MSQLYNVSSAASGLSAWLHTLIATTFYGLLNVLCKRSAVVTFETVAPAAYPGAGAAQARVRPAAAAALQPGHGLRAPTLDLSAPYAMKVPHGLALTGSNWKHRHRCVFMLGHMKTFYPSIIQNYTRETLSYLCHTTVRCSHCHRCTAPVPSVMLHSSHVDSLVLYRDWEGRPVDCIESRGNRPHTRSGRIERLLEHTYHGHTL